MGHTIIYGRSRQMGRHPPALVLVLIHHDDLEEFHHTVVLAYNDTMMNTYDCLGQGRETRTWLCFRWRL